MCRAYHVTRKGNAARIVRDGFSINIDGGALYGRGIYFWELSSDAHAYGKSIFGSGSYEIVEWDLDLGRSIIYDPARACGSPDSIAIALRNRGYRVMIIPRYLMQSSTLSNASGKAFCWLVDLFS